MQLNNIKFSSYMIAVYKFVVQLDPDPDYEIGFYSLDSGQHENPFQGNYFDMNEGHLSGNMIQMRIGK